MYGYYIALCIFKPESDRSIINTKFGNRLLNWPKLLGLYADGFSIIFVPECVPYIIPHMFQLKKLINSLKILCFRPLLTSFTHQNSGTDSTINMALVRFAH